MAEVIPLLGENPLETDFSLFKKKIKKQETVICGICLYIIMDKIPNVYLRGSMLLIILLRFLFLSLHNEKIR